MHSLIRYLIIIKEKFMIVMADITLTKGSEVTVPLVVRHTVIPVKPEMQ